MLLALFRASWVADVMGKRLAHVMRNRHNYLVAGMTTLVLLSGRGALASALASSESTCEGNPSLDWMAQFVMFVFG